MLASYFSTNVRRTFQAGRNGLLMSMWARQIHFPFRRSHNLSRGAGWGSWTTTMSASSSAGRRRSKFRAFTSSYTFQSLPVMGTGCPWRPLWMDFVTSKKRPDPWMTSQDAFSPSSVISGVIHSRISATPPPSRVEFTWTIRVPLSFSPNRRNCRMTAEPTIPSYAESVALISTPSLR